MITIQVFKSCLKCSENFVHQLNFLHKTHLTFHFGTELWIFKWFYTYTKSKFEVKRWRGSLVINEYTIKDLRSISNETHKVTSSIYISYNFY